jgi:hypothetical protein
MKKQPSRTLISHGFLSNACAHEGRAARALRRAVCSQLQSARVVLVRLELHPYGLASISEDYIDPAGDIRCDGANLSRDSAARGTSPGSLPYVGPLTGILQSRGDCRTTVNSQGRRTVRRPVLLSLKSISAEMLASTAVGKSRKIRRKVPQQKTKNVIV